MKETYLKGFEEYMLNQDRTISTINNYIFQIKIPCILILQRIFFI